MSACHQKSIYKPNDAPVERQHSNPKPMRLWPNDEIRWDENAGLRRDAIRSQVIDALEAQEIKETGNEED
jgi:hypothetical protein